MTDLVQRLDVAPFHPPCRRRHSPDLPCWVGRYIKRHLELVISTYGSVCCHCSSAGADSVEHVRPRSKWGTDDLANLRPAHIGCNASRGTKPMTGYRDTDDVRPATRHHSAFVDALLTSAP